MSRRGRPFLLALMALLALVVLTFVSNFLGGRFGQGPRPEADEPQAARPTGRVSTAEGSPPPTGVRVVALGPGPLAEVRTDANGEFRFDPEPEGVTEYEAVVGPLRARAPAGSGLVLLRFPDHFDASGRVVQAGTGEPVEGAEVRCGGRSSRTGPRGRFRLTDVAVENGRAPPLEVLSDRRAPLRFEPPPDAAWDDLFIRME